MKPAVLLWVLAWNLIAFVLMGADKWKARHDSWRVRESTLFLSAALGGSVGALAGMYLFHHKTLHKRFTVGIPLILVLQIALAVFLVRRGVLPG